MYQGGSSRKQGPRLAMRDADDEPPRDAPVRPCEWPLEDFMDQAGVGFYLHREGPNLVKNIVSLVSFYHPPRRTVRDPLPEIRRF